jgi:glutamate/tyrosine decarboxylase-like PLP-dependent enzyme
MLAARHSVLERAGWDVEADGLAGAPRVTVLVGEEVHPSLMVALRMAGFGETNARRVAGDEQGAMRADALAEAVAGVDGPLIVCAQAGNVNSGACDPLGAIADATHRAGGWMHVDGAFGLWARAAPSLSGLVDGAERADSWSVDAHKWLNVPYDSAIAILADPAAAAAAVGTSASYLPASDGREPFQTVPEMSRRMRAAPIYAALRSLGREGLAGMIERCCALARRLAASMEALEGVEVLNEVVLNQVLVRFRDDETTTRVVEAVQREGTAWVGGTVWRGRAAVRVSVSNWSTTERDIGLLVESFERALASADGR